MGTIKEDIIESSEWISKALQSSGYQTDFSPRSLWEIDRFFNEQTQNGKAKLGGLLAKDLGPRLFAIGAYVGEVLRRAKGGEWVGDDADPQVEINVALHFTANSCCWPIQRVMKRFKNGAEDGIAVYGCGLGLDIGAAPKLQQKAKILSGKQLFLYLLIGCVALAISLWLCGK